MERRLLCVVVTARRYRTKTDKQATGLQRLRFVLGSVGTPLAPLSFECVCLSVYIGKGWSSVLPTSGVTSKWRKEALGKHDTDLGGPLCPEIDSPSQMGDILQPIFC